MGGYTVKANFEDRRCLVCETVFETRTSSVRKYCSDECRFNALNLPRYIGYMHHKKECWFCGNKNKLHIHHVSGDRGNNHPANLIPLCSRCHQRVHSLIRNFKKHQAFSLATTLERAKKAGLLNSPGS